MSAQPVTAFIDRLQLARDILEHREQLRAETPVSELDQAQAAARDVFGRCMAVGDALRALEPEGNWRQVVYQDVELDKRAYVMAAVMGCLPCPHIRELSPRPLVADLNHRLLLCDRCNHTRRRRVDDLRCEVCDSYVADNIFHAVVLAVAGILAVGNVGADCCAWLVGEEVTR